MDVATIMTSFLDIFQIATVDLGYMYIYYI